ncbi:PhnE/PtxC family ABC transporter permease, partial [Enterobacter hormaechei]
DEQRHHLRQDAVQDLFDFVRSATVVGMVGAGGIGVTLWEAIRGFQFQQTCALMVLIIVTVSLLDFLSQRLRKHFI